MQTTLWQAFKAVIRGQIISFENLMRKKLRNCLLEIQKGLMQLETGYKSSTDSITLQNIILLTTEV